jgi:hypothetical protein
MTSQIDPDIININYPVAGQDNSTQGFRDNFRDIQLNFESARDEINDLQSKVLLKQPLGNISTPAQNVLNGALLYGGSIQNFSAAAVISTTPVSGTANVNYQAGHYQTIVIDGNLTLNLENFPSLIQGVNQQGWLILRVNAEAGETLTFPAAVDLDSLKGMQGLNNRTITFAASGVYEFEFRQIINTIYVNELTRPKNTWTSPLFITGTDTVANAASISLTTATSLFNVGNTDQTANLAAGTDGQVKVLALASKGTGNLTITVSNAGWQSSGSGTATFDALGQACTLQYFNSKWYCVGNNGVAFA